jgi:CTP synthase (UTP-ammonia lyase)
MKLAIIGDYSSQYKPHKATNEAIAHSVINYGIPLQYDWISTDKLGPQSLNSFSYTREYHPVDNLKLYK